MVGYKYMEECPICLCSIENSSVTTTGCCHKQMHSKCYFKCMSFKSECPMCRAPQTPIEVVVPVPVAVMQVPIDTNRKFSRSVFTVVFVSLVATVVIWKAETS